MEERHSGGLLHRNPPAGWKRSRQTGNLSQFLTTVRPPMQTLLHLAFANCTVAARMCMSSIFRRYYSALNRSNSKFP